VLPQRIRQLTYREKLFLMAHIELIDDEKQHEIEYMGVQQMKVIKGLFSR
jgi:hypothetical protein